MLVTVRMQANRPYVYTKMFQLGELRVIIFYSTVQYLQLLFRGGAYS
jgi:hypothetical protein